MVDCIALFRVARFVLATSPVVQEFSVVLRPTTPEDGVPRSHAKKLVELQSLNVFVLSGFDGFSSFL